MGQGGETSFNPKPLQVFSTCDTAGVIQANILKKPTVVSNLLTRFIRSSNLRPDWSQIFSSRLILLKIYKEQYNIICAKPVIRGQNAKQTLTALLLLPSL